jgi:hypothetical protein
MGQAEGEESMRKKQVTAVCAAVAAALAAAGGAGLFAGTAAAEPGTSPAFGSIPFACVSGPLAGQAIIVDVTPGEPGAAGFVNGTVYLLESITVTVAGVGVVDQHTYGQRNGLGAPSECVAVLGGTTIDTVVAPAGPAS